MSRYPGWTDRQITLLQDNLTTPLAELMPIINSAGPYRTRKAVSDRRGEMVGAPRREPGMKLRYTGWPVLEGTDEERDAEFVRIVAREMDRLNMIKREAARQTEAA
jgi:hypothetical protein